MKKIRIPLLPRIIIAIALGVLLGKFMPESIVRIFATFNDIFGQFLGFLIPLIIIGLVTPAIAEIGKGAGKLLIATAALAYFDTVLAGLLTYGTGRALFPGLIESAAGLEAVSKPESLQPYFSIQIPAAIDVMGALVLSFILGICIAQGGAPTMKKFFAEFRDIISLVIAKTIVPLLPLYIFGIFLSMTMSGQVWHILSVFAMIIVVIFALHIFVLLYEFAAAGLLTHRNPLRLLARMMPAYFTALGTASSAATIPVTLKQTKENGVSDEIAAFTIPLCSTIHMSGSTLKITACALTICMIQNMPYDFPLFLNFILMLGICMVAAPGVPGGSIMAALAPLSSILGFGAEAQALMIALYIAMDSFGTACNVTGDGAIALIVDKWFRKKEA